MGEKSEFQVQDSFFEYCFWRFEKRIALSEKKQPLVKLITHQQGKKPSYMQ